MFRINFAINLVLRLISASKRSRFVPEPAPNAPEAVEITRVQKT